MKSRRDKLVEDTERDLQRLARRERERPGMVGLLVYGGTVGLLFAVPTVLGAYLGRWLDSLVQGYSVRWTVSCIVLGIALGGYNAYRFIRDRL